MRLMNKKSTCVKVHREILEKVKVDFPEYTANDVFKMGYTTLKGLNKANELIYGKARVKRARGL